MSALVRNLKVATVAMIGMLLASSRSEAAATIKEEVAAIAKEVQKTLEDEKQDSVAVGDFTGPASMETNFGPAIQKALINELTKLKISVIKKASLSIKGDYFRGDDPNKPEQRVTVNMVFRIHAANGRVKADSPRRSWATRF